MQLGLGALAWHSADSGGACFKCGGKSLRAKSRHSLNCLPQI